LIVEYPDAGYRDIVLDVIEFRSSSLLYIRVHRSITESSVGPGPRVILRNGVLGYDNGVINARLPRSGRASMTLQLPDHGIDRPTSELARIRLDANAIASSITKSQGGRLRRPVHRTSAWIRIQTP
jgi:hypothetical protein